MSKLFSIFERFKSKKENNVTEDEEKDKEIKDEERSGDTENASNKEKIKINPAEAEKSKLDASVENEEIGNEEIGREKIIDPKEWEKLSPEEKKEVLESELKKSEQTANTLESIGREAYGDYGVKKKSGMVDKVKIKLFGKKAIPTAAENVVEKEIKRMEKRDGRDILDKKEAIEKNRNTNLKNIKDLEDALGADDEKVIELKAKIEGEIKELNEGLYGVKEEGEILEPGQIGELNEKKKPIEEAAKLKIEHIDGFLQEYGDVFNSTKNEGKELEGKIKKIETSMEKFREGGSYDKEIMRHAKDKLKEAKENLKIIEKIKDKLQIRLDSLKNSKAEAQALLERLNAIGKTPEEIRRDKEKEKKEAKKNKKEKAPIIKNAASTKSVVKEPINKTEPVVASSGQEGADINSGEIVSPELSDDSDGDEEQIPSKTRAQLAAEAAVAEAVSAEAVKDKTVGDKKQSTIHDNENNKVVNIAHEREKPNERDAYDWINIINMELVKTNQPAIESVVFSFLAEQKFGRNKILDETQAKEIYKDYLIQKKEEKDRGDNDFTEKTKNYIKKYSEIEAKIIFKKIKEKDLELTNK